MDYSCLMFAQYTQTRLNECKREEPGPSRGSQAERGTASSSLQWDLPSLFNSQSSRKTRGRGDKKDTLPEEGITNASWTLLWVASAVIMAAKSRRKQQVRVFSFSPRSPSPLLPTVVAAALLPPAVRAVLLPACPGLGLLEKTEVRRWVEKQKNGVHNMVKSFGTPLISSPLAFDEGQS